MDIVSTIRNNKYSYMSGTFCAAPFVAAQAALLYNCSAKELTYKEIKDIIMKSVTKMDTLENKCVSGGMINIKNSSL